ncbi:MAG TPA: zinc-binding dehydrogenase [Planctomycetota bacterium]|nr:zinc-binding dehydrogenase [Planctomycetota bacterium]
MPQIRAAVIPAPNADVELREFPEPDLPAGGVLMRTIYSEVCGTDVHLFHGKLNGVPYPLIPGHVAVGVAEKVNGNVIDVHGRPIREGQTLTYLDVHKTCGRCWYCQVAKASTRCPHRKVYGITYGAADGLHGGWAEKMLLLPGMQLLQLPITVAPEVFIGGGCGLQTAVHAIERADIKLGDSVVVLGSGPVGLSCAGLAALSGACFVLVSGAPEERLMLAEKFGADEVLDIRVMHEADRVDAVRRFTEGRGADVVIEACGQPRAVREALQMVRDQGRVVVVGQYTDQGEVSLNPHGDINRKHVDVRGVWGSDFSHLYTGIRLLERFQERVPWRELCGRVYPLDRAAEALNDIREQRCAKAILKPSARS